MNGIGSDPVVLRISDFRAVLNAPKHRPSNHAKWQEITAVRVLIHGHERELHLNFEERHRKGTGIRYIHRTLICPRCEYQARRIYALRTNTWCDNCG